MLRHFQQKNNWPKVSRYIIDHYLLNFILTHWAMLPASCALNSNRKRLMVMVAPHNTGKSNHLDFHPGQQVATMALKLRELMVIPGLAQRY